MTQCIICDNDTEFDIDLYCNEHWRKHAKRT